MRLILLALLITSVGAEVSENLIDPNAWEIEGDVLYSPGNYIRFGTDGGSATQDIDFSTYEQINTIKYGMQAIGCNNEGYSWCDVGTAYDELVITLKYGDEEFVYNVQLDYHDGFISFDNVVDPVATYADSGWIKIYGRDVGVWSGGYGPITQNHFLEVNYTIPTYDPVMDDPEFIRNITGETQALESIAIPTATTEITPLPEIQTASVINDIKQETSSPKVEPKAPAPEIKVEAKQSESTDNQTSKNSIRLDTIMQNVTIDGVPASETEESSSYNDIAQAVAISLLMAQEIKEIEFKDVPFYKQEQMPDTEMNKVYTGYNAYNSSLMNKLVDMQWQN